MIYPPTLQPGDTIGVVSVSAPLPTRESLKVDLLALKRLGFRTKIAPHTFRFSTQVLLSAEQRAADFHRLISDPEVKAVIFSCGGAHAINLLEYLDFDLIRRHPKIIVGFSDCTFLLAAIYARTGLVTFYGPTVWYCFSHLTPFTRRGFLQMTTRKPEVALTLPFKRHPNVLRQGKARGRLIGGNLDALQGLIGTPFEPDWRKAILYFEHFSAPSIIFSEMLNHFRLAGVFDQISGMLIGNLPGISQADLAEHPSLRVGLRPTELVLHHSRGFTFPIIANCQFGHYLDDYWTVPNGVEAEINTEPKPIIRLQP